MRCYGSEEVKEILDDLHPSRRIGADGYESTKGIAGKARV